GHAQLDQHQVGKPHGLDRPAGSTDVAGMAGLRHDEADAGVIVGHLKWRIWRGPALLSHTARPPGRYRRRVAANRTLYGILCIPCSTPPSRPAGGHGPCSTAPASNG